MYRTAITLVKRAKWIIGPVGAIVIVVGAMYTVAAVHGQANPVSAIVTTLGDGRTEFTLHNYASVPITAYAIRSSTQTKNGTLRSGWLKDSAMSPLVPPIAPGGEVSLIVAQAGQHPYVQLGAVLFKGGSTYGDRAWIARLQNERTYFVQALRIAASDATVLASQSTNAAELAQRLDQQKKARIAAVAKPTVTDTFSSHDLKSMLAEYYRLAERETSNNVRCGGGVSVTQCAQSIASDLQLRAVNVAQ